MLNRLQLELGFAAAVFGVGVVGLLGSRELEVAWGSDGPQAGFFPFRLSLVLMAAAAVIAVQSWRARASLRQVVMVHGEGAGRVLRFGLPIVAMTAVAQVLGLYVASALYLLLTIRLGARRPWHTALGVAVGVTVATFVVFEYWFQVPLLKGPLEVMLGLG